MLECVVNVSEGRREPVVAELAAACGSALLDVHSDPNHNRSVFTLVGEEAPRALAAAAVSALDVRSHVGVHPRIGVVDVVAFVPLPGSGSAGSPDLGEAVAARDRFASWMANELGVPCFLYGPERSLPDVRREAFRGLMPDMGPASPHVSAGACAVGARPVLVAYNVWLADGVGVDVARSVAGAVRRPGVVRALGLDVGGRAQVSCNLVAPLSFGPAELFDAVAALAPVAGAELVGLVPSAVLDAVPSGRWAELDLGPERTIESRLRPRRP